MNKAVINRMPEDVMTGYLALWKAITDPRVFRIITNSIARKRKAARRYDKTYIRKSPGERMEAG